MAISIGTKIPDFSLSATDGRVYGPLELAGSATVIIFWCNHCPYVVPNQDRVIDMQEKFRDRGVKFAAICANNAATHPADSFPNMRVRAKEKGYNFPYLHDESQETATTFGAERTPEVFLFDEAGVLRYHGRIDDNYEEEGNVQSHDLRNALEAVLAGNAPDPAETGAYGCTIKWK